MRQIQREELEFPVIEDLIRRDVSFSHSLLTYLNSAAFDWEDRVESVRHGLLLMGSAELRKWVWMASLSSLGQSRPPVLMAQVLMRGRFCEEIAKSAKLPLGESDPFLLGMFSLLDAILGRPLKGILDDLNISRNIRDALLGTAREGIFCLSILGIVKSYEVADWAAVDAAAQIISMPPEDLLTSYMDSLSWVDAVFKVDEQKPQADSLSAPMGFRRNTETQHLTQ